MVARYGGDFGPYVYSRESCGEKWLIEPLHSMVAIVQQGIHSSKDIFYSLLQEFTKKKDLASARHVQSLVTSHGLDCDAFWGDHLIRMFTSCESLLEASRAFSRILKPSVYTWSAIISAHSKLGSSARALELYDRMQQEGIHPNKVIFLSSLRACRNLGVVEQGRLIHDSIIRSGFALDIVMGNSLVDMYAKCGSLEQAHNVFDRLPYRDVISWSAIIAGYAAHGNGLLALELFEKMQKGGIKSDRVIFLFMLKACGSIGVVGQVRLIYEQIMRTGFESDVFVGSTLVDVYAKCGYLDEARKVFDKLPNRNAVVWTTMVAGYAQHGHRLPAIELLENMHLKAITLDRVTYLSILKTCGSLEAIKHGRLIHDQIIRSGLQSNTVVGNTLVDMYAKCASLDEARKVFERLPNQDLVSWGALIAGYAGHGHGHVALQLFEKMCCDGIKPNIVIFLCALKACSSITAIDWGMQIHEQIVRNSFESDVTIGNTLVDMYAKCTRLEEARKVFMALQCRDVVSWGAMIAGCAEQGHVPSSLELYKKMHEDGIKADKVVFLCVLKACGTTGATEHGRLIHAQIIQSGLVLDLVVGNTLVDMYAKCGTLEDACKMFDRLPSRDLVSWAAIIAGYARYGKFRLAGQCLKDMQQEGLKPHDGVFMSILVACSHAGVLEEGHQYFKLMVENHGIMPTIEHYNCIIDLLGRAGLLNEAVALLETMPVPPDVIIWTSLLTSCRTYHNVELGRRCFDVVVQSGPVDASAYILMSNIYADAHKWENVDSIQELRKCAGAQKKRGMTRIEVNNKVHEFIVGDQIFPEDQFILFKFRQLSRHMKGVGYLPQLDLVLEPISNEDILFGTSEEEAIDFELISSVG